jgi:plastocyanin
MFDRLPLAISCGLLMLGCERSRVAQKPEEAKRVEYFHVDPATAGTLGGKITLQGKAPAKIAISMNAEAWCEQAHKDHPVYDQPVIAGKDAGLANAFVYIQSGLEGKTFEPVQETVALDQHGCMFVPRIIGIRAGQTLRVINSDGISHNIHPMPKSNREWNQQQEPQAPDLQRKFARTEIMIPVKCNVHAWMHANIGVMEHPYFAVTGPDGSFTWNNVPPGDYTVAVWHEKLGEQSKQIHVEKSATARIDFVYR